ncbi:MAG: tetratricopeptide repeat protein [Gammaproteobacteria bacterium]|nr:tetratricopeptide repeat protein [Gammaproteobacteria bacterium]
MFDNSGRRPYRGALALLSALLCLAPLQAGAAQSAAASFADGNRLFRDDLYWAALLRYRQAADAGMDTPVLHYNMGVAHYRAAQHIRAREALLKAAQSPQLRVLSHYNLGLNAYAAGDIDAALNWFRQARDQEQNADISRLSRIAISRLRAIEKQADPPALQAETLRQDRRLTNFELVGSVGFGNDDNVFRTPDQAYIDLSSPNLPLVVPVVASGVFMPIDFRAKYLVNSLKFENFFGEYRLTGRYYQDKALDNANEFSHEARFGSEFRRKTETRERRVYSAFTFAQHDETYYDTDDGSERQLNGEPIDDRLNYVRYGPELAFRQSHAKLSLGLRMKGQLWNYEETGAVPEYDHEYFFLGGNVQYRFTSTSLLRLTVDKYSRRYGDRPAFDRNGQQLITNPTVRYDYIEAGLIARQRITPKMWFGFNLSRTERTDRHLGYNDYTRDQFGLDYHWRAGDRIKVELGGYYRSYDFPNAFAFHNPVAGVKTLETVRGKLHGRFRMTSNLSLVAEAIYDDSASNDVRIDYDRLRFSLGVTWQQ